MPNLFFIYYTPPEESKTNSTSKFTFIKHPKIIYNKKDATFIFIVLNLYILNAAN